MTLRCRQNGTEDHSVTESQAETIVDHPGYAVVEVVDGYLVHATISTIIQTDSALLEPMHDRLREACHYKAIDHVVELGIDDVAGGYVRQILWALYDECLNEPHVCVR